MRKQMMSLCAALVAIGACTLLTGCNNGGKTDVTKEPNQDLKAGPPSADPRTLEEIRKHTTGNGQQAGGQPTSGQPAGGQ